MECFAKYARYLTFQETVSLSTRFTFRIKKAEFIRTSHAKQELKATSTGYRTNFRRVEQFDRTCCSHGIEQSFSYDRLTTELQAD